MIRHSWVNYGSKNINMFHFRSQRTWSRFGNYKVFAAKPLARDSRIQLSFENFRTSFQMVYKSADGQ